jgi:hypothetical protein
MTRKDGQDLHAVNDAAGIADRSVYRKCVDGAEQRRDEHGADNDPHVVQKQSDQGHYPGDRGKDYLARVEIGMAFRGFEQVLDHGPFPWLLFWFFCELLPDFVKDWRDHEIRGRNCYEALVCGNVRHLFYFREHAVEEFVRDKKGCDGRAGHTGIGDIRAGIVL